MLQVSVVSTHSADVDSHRAEARETSVQVFGVTDEETGPAQRDTLLWPAVEPVQGPALLRLGVTGCAGQFCKVMTVGKTCFPLTFSLPTWAYTAQFCDFCSNVPSISSPPVLVQVSTTAPQMSETLCQFVPLLRSLLPHS